MDEIRVATGFFSTRINKGGKSKCIEERTIHAICMDEAATLV
jgi:hypothetical protein